MTTTMTEDITALRALLEKGSDATFLREMIGFVAQRLMELETEGLCGAGPGERSPQRVNQRNGCRARDWKTVPLLRGPPCQRGWTGISSRGPGRVCRDYAAVLIESISSDWTQLARSPWASASPSPSAGPIARRRCPTDRPQPSAREALPGRLAANVGSPHEART